MITKECLINEIQYLIEEYIHGLSSPFDSFLEEHILSSTFYMIQEGSKIVGYYAIHNKELLTQFYISRTYLMFSQRMFNRMLERNSVNSLFVPTSDELFVSLAVDKDFTINKQAYFFQDNQADIIENIVSSDESFRPAILEDLQQIQQICGDFLDQYERRITNGELFTYYRGSVLLGIGVVEKSKMIKGLASIGMFTNETYRQQGIGRVDHLTIKKMV